MYLDTPALEKVLRLSYPKDEVKGSKFLGITNGGQFCYEILYYEPTVEGDAYTKVFVDLDCNDEPYAEY